MKFKWNKLLAAVLTTGMLAGSLSGCGSSTESPSKESAEETAGATEENGAEEVAEIDRSEYYEITIYGDGVDPQYAELQENNSLHKALKEKFNVGFKFESIPGDVKEFGALKLAGEDYPEIIRLYDSTLIKSYIEADALLELGPLLEKYGQNFMESNEDLLPIWKMLSGMNDDKIWVYTSWEPDKKIGNSTPRYEFVVRSDILEQQGWPEITTEKDLLDVLEQGLKDNPETAGKPTVGLSVPMAWGDIGMLVVQGVHTLGSPSLDVFNQSVWGGWDYTQDKFVDVKRDIAYKEGLKFWNDAWKRGILDREAVTDNTDTFSEKMAQGRPLAGYYAVWGINGFNKEFEQQGLPYRYVPVPIMLECQVERGDSKYQFTLSPTAHSAMAITKNAKHPERIMEVLDWLATEEGKLLYGWGEEGVQYTVDENGKKTATPEFMDKYYNDPDYQYSFGGPRGNAGLGFVNGVDENGQLWTIESDSDVVMAGMDSIVQEVYEQYGWGNVYGMYRSNDKIKFDDTRSTDIKNITPALTDEQVKTVEKVKTTSADYALKMILAENEEEFNQLYEELLQTTDEMGLPEIIEQWDTEYKSLCEQYGITP